jgi:hypothetical protein
VSAGDTTVTTCLLVRIFRNPPRVTLWSQLQAIVSTRLTQLSATRCLIQLVREGGTMSLRRIHNNSHSLKATNDQTSGRPDAAMKPVLDGLMLWAEAGQLMKATKPDPSQVVGQLLHIPDIFQKNQNNA